MIGKHSLVKDKEAQVAVVRSNHHLRESLHKVNSCLNKYNMYTRRGNMCFHAIQLQLEAITDPQHKLIGMDSH